RRFLDETDLDIAGFVVSRNGLFVAGWRCWRRLAPQREVHDLLVWRRRERAAFPGLLCARGWLLQSVSARRQSSWRRKIFLRQNEARGDVAFGSVCGRLRRNVHGGAGRQTPS